MTVKLSALPVGDIVKLNVNGVAKDFIVVHQGLPSSIYDSSCNGTWLLMRECYTKRAFRNDGYNLYGTSDIHTYLNETFLNLLDVDIRGIVAQIKLPYVKSGQESSVTSGANGLSTKVFLLGYSEVGWLKSQDSGSFEDGACLSYFTGTAKTDTKRVALYDDGTNAIWWLRTPNSSGLNYAFNVLGTGGMNAATGKNIYGIRPALVVGANAWVDDNGILIANAPPTITSTSGSSGVNLGIKTTQFTFQYTVADASEDDLTITEYLDGIKQRSFSTSGGLYTFNAIYTAANFQKILNGLHTLEVVASDGVSNTSFTAKFTKSVTSASITLKTPLTVSGDITMAMLTVNGIIPNDATYKVEVTNNAKDTNPVWQDVTAEVKKGVNILFDNTTCANGAAFNFRITAAEGESGESGYISVVSGAFQ